MKNCTIVPAAAGTLLVAGVLAGCTGAPPGAHVDPALSILVPADTVMLAEVHVEKLLETPLYQRYLADREIPQLDAFAEQTGLDVRTELWEVLFLSDGEHSAALGRGEFSDESEPRLKLEASGAKRFGYKTYTFIGDEESAVVFLSPSLAGAGDTAMLRAIIDTRDQTNGPPAVLADRMAEIPSEAAVWAVYAGPPIKLPETDGPLANVAKIAGSIESGFLYADLRTGFSGRATTDTTTDQDAKQLHDALRGLVGMGRLMSPPDHPELLRLYDSVRVTQEGSRTNLSLDASEEAVEALVEAWPGLMPGGDRPGPF